MSRILFVLLVIAVSCAQPEDRPRVIETDPPPPNALEIAPAEEPQVDLDAYSKETLTEMATETGEINQQVAPAIEFWEKVSNNGDFARFQEALKAAKSDEDRWKIADQFPEIAERSGMIDALPPRDSSKTEDNTVN